LPKWPFFLGDALLLSLAFYITRQSSSLNSIQILSCILCVAVGAAFAIVPFVLEYRAAAKLSEAAGLTNVVSQVQNLEQLAAQIGYATSQWQVVRESSDKTANAAREIAQGMSNELKSFNEFLRRANDTEKSSLRLEVDKQRRAEAEWLQVLVRILDHVYALHQAGIRSRQLALIEQLGNFQNACRDTARRVGLTAFIAADAEQFDRERHRLVDDKMEPADGAVIAETIAAGYTFQGKLLRPALVRLRNSDEPRSVLVEKENVGAVPEEAGAARS
jgi:molecular chaperone GrpE (heat shock protein)